MENQTHDPRDPRFRGGARNMRASDADREAMAEILRRHYAAGRLDAEEFEERIGQCLSAKRLSDLDGLLTDLPREPEPPPPEPPWYAHRPPWRFAIIAPIILALIAICAFTGAHLLWLAFPLFFFFVFRPFGCWYGPGRGQQAAGDRR